MLAAFFEIFIMLAAVVFLSGGVAFAQTLPSRLTAEEVNRVREIEAREVNRPNLFNFHVSITGTKQPSTSQPSVLSAPLGTVSAYAGTSVRLLAILRAFA
jgi:hypothetical protein